MNNLFRRFYGAVCGENKEPIPISEAIRVTRIMENLFKDCKAIMRTTEQGTSS
jgi:hypothetical protein